MRTKFIFITGGVLSSLARARGGLHRMPARGPRPHVTNIKLDPYINVDPGTMNPFQHGEVFVTDDGAETDLDLGHYERFTSSKLGKLNNLTTARCTSPSSPRSAAATTWAARSRSFPTSPTRSRNTSTGPRRLRRGHRRDRRHRGRHRGPALSRGGPSVPLRRRKTERRLHHLTWVPFLKTAGEVKTKPSSTAWLPFGRSVSSRTSSCAERRITWPTTSRPSWPFSATSKWSPSSRQGCGAHLRRSPHVPPAGCGREDREPAQHLDGPAQAGRVEENGQPG